MVIWGYCREKYSRISIFILSNLHLPYSLIICTRSLSPRIWDDNYVGTCMCARVFVCLSVCICTCVPVCACVCMYVYLCVRMFVYTYVCACACVYVYLCTRACMHVYLCVCMCVSVPMCTYVCACVYVCLCACAHACVYVYLLICTFLCWLMEHGCWAIATSHSCQKIHSSALIKMDITLPGILKRQFQINM